MTLTETITWIPVAERLPDAEDEIDRRMGESRTVLAWIDGAAFRAYVLLATGEWRLADDNLATGIAPTHWAEVPRGPARTTTRASGGSRRPIAPLQAWSERR